MGCETDYSTLRYSYNSSPFGPRPDSRTSLGQEERLPTLNQLPEEQENNNDTIDSQQKYQNNDLMANSNQKEIPMDFRESESWEQDEEKWDQYVEENMNIQRPHSDQVLSSKISAKLLSQVSDPYNINPKFLPSIDLSLDHQTQNEEDKYWLSGRDGGSVCSPSRPPIHEDCALKIDNLDNLQNNDFSNNFYSKQQGYQTKPITQQQYQSQQQVGNINYQNETNSENFSGASNKISTAPSFPNSKGNFNQKGLYALNLENLQETQNGQFSPKCESQQLKQQPKYGNINCEQQYNEHKQSKNNNNNRGNVTPRLHRPLGETRVNLIQTSAQGTNSNVCQLQKQQPMQSSQYHSNNNNLQQQQGSGGKSKLKRPGTAPSQPLRKESSSGNMKTRKSIDNKIIGSQSTQQRPGTPKQLGNGNNAQKKESSFLRKSTSSTFNTKKKDQVIRNQMNAMQCRTQGGVVNCSQSKQQVDNLKHDLYSANNEIERLRQQMSDMQNNYITERELWSQQLLQEQQQSQKLERDLQIIRSNFEKKCQELRECEDRCEMLFEQLELEQQKTKQLIKNQNKCQLQNAAKTGAAESFEGNGQTKGCCGMRAKVQEGKKGAKETFMAHLTSYCYSPTKSV